jgi:hypothetical protein
MKKLCRSPERPLSSRGPFDLALAAKVCNPPLVSIDMNRPLLPFTAS